MSALWGGIHFAASSGICDDAFIPTSCERHCLRSEDESLCAHGTGKRPHPSEER